MKNPCKECLVDSMCSQVCDKLVDYIDKTAIHYKYNYLILGPQNIARYLRSGIYKIEGNTIRRVRDNISMLELYSETDV